jgi:hypothetical protein
MRGVVRTRFRKRGSIAADERGALDAGGRAAAAPAGGVLEKSYRSSGLPSKRSSIVHAVRKIAPI